MKTFYEKENKRLIFEIHEDIDECVAKKIRRKLDNEIERYVPKEVIFDFNKVSFMDSAGIGLVIGRYKLANMLGGKVRVANLTTPVKKIFEMSGMLKIIPEVSSEIQIGTKKYQSWDKKVPVLGQKSTSLGTKQNRSQMCSEQNRTGPKCAKCTKCNQKGGRV